MSRLSSTEAGSVALPRGRYGPDRRPPGSDGFGWCRSCGHPSHFFVDLPSPSDVLPGEPDPVLGRPELGPADLRQPVSGPRVEAEPLMGPDPVRGAREPVWPGPAHHRRAVAVDDDPGSVRAPAELPVEKLVTDPGPVLPGGAEPALRQERPRLDPGGEPRSYA